LHLGNADIHIERLKGVEADHQRRAPDAVEVVLCELARGPPDYVGDLFWGLTAAAVDAALADSKSQNLDQASDCG